MFEHYTEEARRAIFFARYEASTFGSDSIKPEHLLLAIIRIKAMPYDLSEIEQGDAKIPTNVDMVISNELKILLSRAKGDPVSLGSLASALLQAEGKVREILTNHPDLQERLSEVK